MFQPSKGRGNFESAPRKTLNEIIAQTRPIFPKINFISANVAAVAEFGLREGGVFGAEEVVEADVVEDGGGGEGCDVSAEFAGLAVGADDHREGVPADIGADVGFAFVVAGGGLLEFGGDGVDVGGGGLVRQGGAGLARLVGEGFQQKVRAFGSGVVDDGRERFLPLPRLVGIGVGGLGDGEGHCLGTPVLCFLSEGDYATEESRKNNFRFRRDAESGARGVRDFRRCRIFFSGENLTRRSFLSTSRRSAKQ